MKTEKLIHPFIVYWDIGPSPSNSEIISRICSELIDSKIFVLNLKTGPGPIDQETMNILNKFRDQQTKVNLTVDRTILDQPMNFIKETGITKLYIKFSSVAQFRDSLNAVEQCINDKIPAGVSFDMNKNNISDITGLLKLCAENRIKDITFPIQRYTGAIFYPDREDSKQLSRELKEIDIEMLNLGIHDPFLWELFHAKENPNKEGCNAAKTMIYISEDLDVTPCPIFPFQLGNLRDMPMKEILSSEKRQEIRKGILTPARECRDCKALNTCTGGCRGRAYLKYNDLNGADPACPRN